MVTSPFRSLTLSLLVLPPILLATYFFSAFPNPPEPLFIHQSLACLPPTAKTWSIYPEDFYPGGAYATFPNGKVRYWLMGPENGKKVVLIHGLSIPAIVWRDIAPTLAARGYRVLLYDLYGRGYSDAPHTTYDTNLYTSQLAFLLQYLRWEKTNVVGLSMGGGIAAAFTAQFPHLVDDAVGLIASGGLIESEDISRTAKFMSSPLVIMLASTRPIQKYLQHLTNSTAAQNANETASSAIVDVVRMQSSHLGGYNHALSSSLREGPIRGLSTAFQSPAFASKRVLLVHGTKDKTVPPKYSTRIMKLLPKDAKVKHVTVEGAGHDVNISNSDVVVNAILGLLSTPTAEWGERASEKS